MSEQENKTTLDFTKLKQTGEALTKDKQIEELRSSAKKLKKPVEKLADNIEKLNSIIEEQTSEGERESRSIAPAEQIKLNKDYSTIRQGTGTNALTKFRATEGKGLNTDTCSDDAEITHGNSTLFIPKENIKGLKTSTYQLLDVITIKLTESGAKSPSVKISLDEYMERRGLTNRKEAKKQVLNDIQVLRSLHFSWEETKGKHTDSYSFVNIADSGEVKRNGDIEFTFGSTFFKALLEYTIMPYPNQLQKINSQYNPNSFNFLRKIAEHKNMNVGGKNENIISVKTLLSVSANIPTYEKVMSGNRNVRSRIIEAFERDMDLLEPTLEWSYCHSKGEHLTDEELYELDYETFINALIEVEWKSYPDQTERLKRREEKIKKAKAKAKAKVKKQISPKSELGAE